MSPREKRSRAEASAGAGASPSMDVLPVGVLHHILGFMEPRQAVRTSILARRWRDLWMSAAAVRMRTSSLASVATYMERRLLLEWPLDTFDIWFHDFMDAEVPRVNIWVRRALLRAVQELNLCSFLRPFPFQDLGLVSQHLRSLKIDGSLLRESSCDFSGCPSLELLEIAHCIFPSAKKISSQSLKRLVIIRCSFNEGLRFRTHIHAPNLVSLVIDDRCCCEDWIVERPGRVPVLHSMPSLREASVRLCGKNADCCSYADESGSCGNKDCVSCYGIELDSNCLLLKGLSEAKNLELLAESEMFVLKRDLKECPTFSKLKTLSLNGYWCVAPDFSALTCILKHSPILEDLTLQFLTEESNCKLRIKGGHNAIAMSAPAQHLKTVEIKCEVIDAGIIKLVKFLSTFDIRLSLDEAEILE